MEFGTAVLAVIVFLMFFAALYCFFIARKTYFEEQRKKKEIEELQELGRDTSDAKEKLEALRWKWGTWVAAYFLFLLLLVTISE